MTESLHYNLLRIHLVNMNIVIPMAGQGTRVDGIIPKPLTKLIHNKTMIQLALESLNIDGNYCFITRKYSNYDWNVELYKILRNTVNSPVIVEIDFLTDGPAISALHAPYLFFEDKDLLITNCDQILFWESTKFLDFLKTTDANGVVVTYNVQTPKNSYALIKKKEEHCVYPQFTEVKEKQIVSKHSLNGIHWVKHGVLFAKAVEEMVKNRDNVNGEYYVGPAFTYVPEIKRVYPIDKKEHWAVGTQGDINKFIDYYRDKYDRR